MYVDVVYLGSSAILKVSLAVGRILLSLRCAVTISYRLDYPVLLGDVSLRPGFVCPASFHG